MAVRFGPRAADQHWVIIPRKSHREAVMSVQPNPYYRFEDYLAVERETRDVKYEYVAGEVFAMTGASFNHNLITANVIGELRNRLKAKPCSILANDMRLRIESADACLYPDMMVVCDPPAFLGQRRDVITNPMVVVEVISPSTEGYDRGGKFVLYRSLPSLRHYVLIAQERLGVDVFIKITRVPGREWRFAYSDRRQGGQDPGVWSGPHRRRHRRPPAAGRASRRR